jgi:hypothetical protein
MKCFFSFVAALLVAFGAAAQTKTDWKKEKLKGKVKSFTLLENYRYKKDGKFTEWGILYNKKYSFDNTGRYTEYTELTATGNLSYKIKYAYSAKDKKATLSYFDKDEKPTVKNVWTYNNKGERTEIQNYTKENKAEWRYVYTYNTNGNRIMQESYKPDSTLYSKTTYTFDDKGNETGYLLQTPGYANSAEKYAYDDKGNKTEVQMLNGKNEINFRMVSIYDTNGNVIEEQNYKGQETTIRNKTTWKYQYDASGNWIKRTQYTIDGIEFDIAERKITYY